MPYLEKGDIFCLTKNQRFYMRVKDESGRLVTITTKAKTKDHDFTSLRFVVYKTAFKGGGTGHGPHDVYRGGHCVYAETFEGKRVRINFYQSGCFTSMILPDEVKAIGKARRKWVELKKPQNRS